MTSAFHDEQSPSIGGIHVIHAYEYADASARTGATGFVSTDIGKVARQTDNNTFYVLTAVTPTWAQITSAGGSDATGEWLFGNGSISGTTTTRYLTPGFDNDLAGIVPIQIRMPRGGTLQNLYIQSAGDGGNSNAIVVTVRKNGSGTSLTASVAADATNAHDTTHTVVVAADDRIDIEVTKASSIGSSPTYFAVTMEFAA